jgi:hypothetical protein
MNSSRYKDKDARRSALLTAKIRGRISGGRKQLTKKRSAMIRVAAGVPEGSPLAPRSTADATIAITSDVATDELKYFAAYGLSTRSLYRFAVQLGQNRALSLKMRKPSLLRSLKTQGSACQFETNPHSGEIKPESIQGREEEGRGP